VGAGAAEGAGDCDEGGLTPLLTSARSASSPTPQRRGSPTTELDPADEGRIRRPADQRDDASGEHAAHRLNSTPVRDAALKGDGHGVSDRERQRLGLCLHRACARHVARESSEDEQDRDGPGMVDGTS